MPNSKDSSQSPSSPPEKTGPSSGDHPQEEQQRLIPLAGSVRAAAQNAEVAGDVDPHERLEITVRVRPRHSLEALDIDQLGNLLPNERAAQPLAQDKQSFGADPADIAEVENFARSHQLEVVESDVLRRSVVLAGTVEQLRNAFGGFELKQYESPQHGRFRGRSGPILIPAELEPIVEGVFGFDNRRQAKPNFVMRDPHVSVLRARFVSTSYTPPQVGRLYNFPQQLDGRGQCIGIIEFGGGFIEADLRTYFQQLGLPVPQVTAVSVDQVGNDPTPPDASGDTPDGEVMLDIEVAGAIAPRAKIVVYFAPFTERGWVDVLSTAIHDTVNKPSVISISWGWPEGDDLWTAQALKAVNDTLKEAALKGVTVLCASGDDGSADELNDSQAHVDFPAASPYILSCGGTTLRGASSGIISEVVWNNGPRSAGGGASGGGVSEMFARPGWQALAGVPRSVNTGKRGRGVPDVSGNADPNTGFRIRVRGQNSISGGTSAVAPLWAGLFALINQSLGKAVGYINPLIYNRLAPLHIFRDITIGNNDTTGRIGGYQAGPGWDACTGWGSPDGNRLLQALSGGSPHGIVPVAAGQGVGGKWERLDGAAYEIAVGADGSVWMIGTTDAAPAIGIYRRSGDKWEAVPGAAVRIAVAPDGTPWIVNAQTQILTHQGDAWQQVPGAAYDLGIGANGSVWAIATNLGNMGYGIYQRVGDKWVVAPGAAVRVAVAPDGTPWVINSQMQIFRWQGGAWQQVPGAAYDLCIGADGSVWAIGTMVTGAGFGIYRWSNTGWVGVDGAAVRVAVDPQGTPYVVNSDHEIYRRA